MTYGELRRQLDVVLGAMRDAHDVEAASLVLMRDHFHCPDEAQAGEVFYPVRLTWKHASGRMAYIDNHITEAMLFDADTAAMVLADLSRRITPKGRPCE